MTETCDSSQRLLAEVAALPLSALKQWLGSALRGVERLPRVTPDEPHDVALGRLVVELAGEERATVYAAVRGLVARFAAHGESDDAYVDALLGLTHKLDVQEAVVPLAEVARAEGFGNLPLAQQAAVLSTLFDLRAPVGSEFWRLVAASGRHPVLALSGLLREGLDGVDCLPRLEGDAAVADAIYFVVRSFGHKLEVAERQKFVERLRRVVLDCHEPIATALRDWLGEQSIEPTQSSKHAGLKALLKARSSADGRLFSDAPKSARLLPQAA